MIKKKNSGKFLLPVLLLSLLLTINTGFSQQVEIKRNTATTELKQLWKKNELLFGIGSAMLFTFIVYALWRKKKRSLNITDSTL